jgi:hypothetical protein
MNTVLIIYSICGALMVIACRNNIKRCTGFKAIFWALSYFFGWFPMVSSLLLVYILFNLFEGNFLKEDIKDDCCKLH